MTPEEERELQPFLDAFAELLLAEDEERRRAEQQQRNELTQRENEGEAATQK